MNRLGVTLCNRSRDAESGLVTQKRVKSYFSFLSGIVVHFRRTKPYLSTHKLLSTSGCSLQPSLPSGMQYWNISDILRSKQFLKCCSKTATKIFATAISWVLVGEPSIYVFMWSQQALKRVENANASLLIGKILRNFTPMYRLDDDLWRRHDQSASTIM